MAKDTVRTPSMAQHQAKGEFGRPGRTKRTRAWFEQKVAELLAEMEKLPSDRQDQLRRELGRHREQ